MGLNCATYASSAALHCSLDCSSAVTGGLGRGPVIAAVANSASALNHDCEIGMSGDTRSASSMARISLRYGVPINPNLRSGHAQKDYPKNPSKRVDAAVI